MTPRRHDQGTTLPELLGAIVIFGLLTTLLASMFTLIVNTTNRIDLIERANLQGTFLVRSLETAMANSGATAYRRCLVNQDGCVILENQYSYELDPVEGDIVLMVHDPVIETRIEVSGTGVWIDGIAIDAGFFMVDSASTLVVTDLSGDVSILITFTLVDSHGESFGFTASHSFTTSDIPTG